MKELEIENNEHINIFLRQSERERGIERDRERENYPPRMNKEYVNKV